MSYYNHHYDSKQNRQRLKEIYHETQEYCKKYANLLHFTPTKRYNLISNGIGSKFKRRFDTTTIRVVNMKTIQAVLELNEILKPKGDSEYKILVLNMASKRHYGGGVKRGSVAQEEDLFRKTDYSLHPIVDKKGKRAYPCELNQYTYTPNVIVVRDHTYKKLLSSEFVKVDMIAMSAITKPELDKQGHLYPADYALTLAKIDTIFKSAVMNYRTDLVLGALGCGAFANPPEDIAKAFKKCQAKYKRSFNSITYAVYSSKDTNYDVFKSII